MIFVFTDQRKVQVENQFKIPHPPFLLYIHTQKNLCMTYHLPLLPNIVSDSIKPIKICTTQKWYLLQRNKFQIFKTKMVKGATYPLIGVTFAHMFKTKITLQ